MLGKWWLAVGGNCCGCCGNHRCGRGNPRIYIAGGFVRCVEFWSYNKEDCAYKYVGKTAVHSATFLSILPRICTFVC